MSEPVEILMVEDNRGDVVLVQEALARVGLACRLTALWNGVDALAFLRRQGSYAAAPRPDLIVLDLKLPRKTGQEVLNEIRADRQLNEIPLIVLSSSRSGLEAAGVQTSPRQRCLLKPSTFKGYIELVQSFESFRRQTRSVPSGVPNSPQEAQASAVLGHKRQESHNRFPPQNE